MIHALYSLLTFHAQNVILAGPAAIPIGLALTALGTGYQIYSSERAAGEAAKQYHDAQNQAAQQRREDLARQDAQKKEMADNLAAQKAQEAKNAADIKASQEASLASARASVPGLRSQMGANLLAQEKSAYEAMSPLIEDRLNALGLLQSGALPESQAKYQAQLEADRQARLGAFETQVNQNLNIDRPLALSADEAARQDQILKSDLLTSRENLSQGFASADANAANEAARQQFLAGLGSGVTQMQGQAGQSIGQGISNLGQGAMLMGSLYNNPNPATKGLNPAQIALLNQRGYKYPQTGFGRLNIDNSNSIGGQFYGMN